MVAGRPVLGVAPPPLSLEQKAQKYRYEVAAGRTPLEVYNQGGSFERGTKADKKKKAKMDKGKVAPAADAREDD